VKFVGGVGHEKKD